MYLRQDSNHYCVWDQKSRDDFGGRAGDNDSVELAPRPLFRTTIERLSLGYTTIWTRHRFQEDDGTHKRTIKQLTCEYIPFATIVVSQIFRLYHSSEICLSH